MIFYKKETEKMSLCPDLVANSLQKNVFEKIYPIVDNTDREVARITAERNREAEAREAEAMEAKKKIAQGLNDYYHKDYRK